MVFVAKKKWYKNLVKIYPNIHQGIMDPNIFHIRISSSVPKWHNLKSFLGISRLNKKVKYDFKKDSTPLCIPRESLSSIDPQPKVTQCGVVHIIPSQHERLCVYKIPNVFIKIFIMKCNIKLNQKLFLGHFIKINVLMSAKVPAYLWWLFYLFKNMFSKNAMQTPMWIFSKTQYILLCYAEIKCTVHVALPKRPIN